MLLWKWIKYSISQHQLISQERIYTLLSQLKKKKPAKTGKTNFTGFFEATSVDLWGGRKRNSALEGHQGDF